MVSSTYVGVPVGVYVVGGHSNQCRSWLWWSSEGSIKTLVAVLVARYGPICQELSSGAIDVGVLLRKATTAAIAATMAAATSTTTVTIEAPTTTMCGHIS